MNDRYIDESPSAVESRAITSLSTRNKQLEAALREAREDLSKIRDEAILNDHYYIDQLSAKAISKIDQVLSASERADGK